MLKTYFTRFSFALCTLFLLGVPQSAMSKRSMRIYISPNGSDIGNGSKKTPLKSVKRAQELVQSHHNRGDVEFVFMDGVHYLAAPIIITPELSDGEHRRVKYTAQNSGKAVISGGEALDLVWRKYEDGIYCAKIEGDNGYIDQLYVNGERKPMARFPNEVAGKNVFGCWDLSHNAVYDASADIFVPERVAKWKNPKGAYIHAMHNALWGDMHWQVLGKGADGKLVYEGGWQNNRPSPMHGVYRFIEHVFEELDSPGEWYYDKDERMLYYYPESEESLADAKVEIVRLSELIELRGSKENPVRGVTIEGLVFRHTARTFMENKEPLLRSDWTTYRGGAITFDGAVDCAVKGCEFDQLGGNAIFVNNYNRDLLFYGCYIHESGANGIAFVGNPESVYNPLFRYGRQDYAKLDLTPGAKSDDYPASCRVEECLFTLTGRFEKQTSPIQISMAHKITVSHCTIYDVPRAGINISEGTFGGHLIEYCDVFNTVLETGDHGSFNSWGRDRYWTPDINEMNAQVEKNPALPYLDILDVTTIRNSRWRCDHGWDIDLDDGSTRYRIYNNLLLAGGLKLREGYDRVATNNIILNNTLHPHVWFKNSGDEFRHNIVFDQYREILMDICIAKDGQWGNRIDSNFFVGNGNIAKAYLVNRCDSNSMWGNPQFRDAEKGDFRVTKKSPALEIGFKNFDTQNFGVTLPHLKAIAKSPEIPALLTENEEERDYATLTWHRARFKNIESLGEQSATGLKDWKGALLIELPENTVLQRNGLRQNDVILRVQGDEIHNIEDLEKIDSKHNTNQPFRLTVWRNQSEMEFTIRYY